jgi:hypothetical protein
MPESEGRSPAAGFLAGVGLGAGAWVVSWLAYQQLERARFFTASTFDFRRIDWLWIQALFVAVGMLVGLTVILAFRGPAGSRRATQTAAAVAVGILLTLAVVPDTSDDDR